MEKSRANEQTAWLPQGLSQPAGLLPHEWPPDRQAYVRPQIVAFEAEATSLLAGTFGGTHIDSTSGFFGGVHGNNTSGLFGGTHAGNSSGLFGGTHGDNSSGLFGGTHGGSTSGEYGGTHIGISFTDVWD